MTAADQPTPRVGDTCVMCGGGPADPVHAEGTHAYTPSHHRPDAPVDGDDAVERVAKALHTANIAVNGLTPVWESIGELQRESWRFMARAALAASHAGAEESTSCVACGRSDGIHDATRPWQVHTRNGAGEAEAHRLPDPKAGCVCTWHTQDAGGGYTEIVAEYEPDCPVHSEHLYDPRSGTWVMRAGEAVDREALYADAVNLAAERSPFGHPLPESEIRAARAGVDSAPAARGTVAPTVSAGQHNAAVQVLLAAHANPPGRGYDVTAWAMDATDAAFRAAGIEVQP